MQIVYFPYLHLNNLDEVSFGNIKVWNFERKASDYIPDEKLRKYVENVITSNIAHNQPIKDVGVLSIDATDFREFNASELEVANEVRLLMFLSFISLHNIIGRGANSGSFIGTSENFEFVLQNFQPESDYIAERSGYIVSIMTGGYKVGEKKFYKPAHVLKPMRFSLDSILLKHLLKLKNRGGKTLYGRILRATDLFFESYYNSPNVSVNARVLLQIAAFETLLDLPQSGQRKDFKDKIEKYCNLATDKQYKHFYENKGVKYPEKRSKKAIWADSYYTLRNHIIHGDVVKPKDFIFKNVQRHIDISILFFVLLIKKLINDKPPGKKMFYDEITWGKQHDNGDVYEGFLYKNNDLTRLINETLKKRKGAKNP